MQICSKCKAEIKDGACPLCLKNKFITEAKENDSIYVTSAEFIFSGIIEDCLNEARIPFVKKGVLGSAISLYVGEGTELYRFYVNLSDYERACEALSILPMPISDDELEKLALEDTEEC